MGDGHFLQGIYFLGESNPTFFIFYSQKAKLCLEARILLTLCVSIETLSVLGLNASLSHFVTSSTREPAPLLPQPKLLLPMGELLTLPPLC